MLAKLTSTFTLFLGLYAAQVSAVETVRVDFGPWSYADLDQIISSTKQLARPGDQVAFISAHFIDTPYNAGTLVGGPHEEERLVINLSGFDCFTLLDTVEALRRASGIPELPDQLKQIRYRGGALAYSQRRHFFSDWVADTTAAIRDVTTVLSPGNTQTVLKHLNLKRDGTLWRPGVAVTVREIRYIPTRAIDAGVVAALNPGDYVGVYSPRDGLDVSHTGMIVKKMGKVLLRHASSRVGVERVVDEDLLSYLQGKPGLVVYRAVQDK